MPINVSSSGCSARLRSGWGGGLWTCGSPKHRVLLAALLAQAGRPVPVERLAEAIWGEAHQPSNPRRTVQLYITRLRGLLAHPVSGEMITTWAGGYQINVRPEQIDLGRFRRFLEAAGHAAGTGDLDAEAAALARALAEWRGEPLAGVPSELLQREVALQLTEQRLQGPGARPTGSQPMDRRGLVIYMAVFPNRPCPTAAFSGQARVAPSGRRPSPHAGKRSTATICAMGAGQLRRRVLLIPASSPSAGMRYWAYDGVEGRRARGT